MLTPKEQADREFARTVRKRTRDQVRAKLEAEGLTIASPWYEIEECLSRTVAPRRCLGVAWEMRQAGL